MSVRCVDGDYEFAYGEVYALQRPVRHEERTYTHARGMYPVHEPTGVRIELFEQDRVPTECEHGYTDWHEVVMIEGQQHQLCMGTPLRPPMMTCSDFMLSRTLVLPRYDPARDPSTYEGAMVMFAHAIHDANKRRR